MSRAVMMMTFAFAMLGCGGKAKPAPPAPTAEKPAGQTPCPAGELLHENACLKECTAASDCAAGQECEQLHSMNEDDTIGPVVGTACQ